MTDPLTPAPSIEDALRSAMAECDVPLKYADAIFDAFSTRLAASPQAPAEPLSDARIDAVTDAQWGKGGVPSQMAHRAYARAILAAAAVRATLASTGAAASPASQLPAILFDGFAVLQGLSPSAQKRTSVKNVGDVLDSVVKILRAASTGEKP